MPRGPAPTPEETVALQRERRDARRRGDRVLVAVARIELFVADLDPLDKLIALNQALQNAIHDGSGGR